MGLEKPPTQSAGERNEINHSLWNILLIVPLVFILVLTLGLGLSKTMAMQGFPFLSFFSPKPQVQILTPSTAQTAPNVLIGCPIAPIVEIHSQPGISAPVGDWLLQGTCVYFDSRTADNAWVRISPDAAQVSKPGWVSASNVFLEKAITQLPESELQSLPNPPTAVSASGAEAGSGVQGCLQQVSSLNVRNGPGVVYNHKAYLLRGACVELQSRNFSSTWVKIEAGWVAASYLEINGDLNQLPIQK
jgi:hypothetical protein